MRKDNQNGEFVEGIVNAFLANDLVDSLFRRDDKLELIYQIVGQYCEPHRHYHSLKHVVRLFELINKCATHRMDRDLLQLVALFHDVIYDPKSKSNEVDSAEFFRKQLALKPTGVDDVGWMTFGEQYSLLTVSVINNINNMILETQYFKKEGSSPVSVAFNKMDLDALINGSFNELLENEMDIFREYQYVEYPVYKKNRLIFLESIKTHPLVVGKNDKNLDTLMEYVKTYVPNIGIYVGSFNPFHIGHRDILKKAEKLFDKVIVVRGINGDKVGRDDAGHANYLFEALPYHEVTGWQSSTTDFIKHVAEYAKVTLIRGLRNGYDFSHEVNQLRFMEDMYGEELPVVFIPCDRKYDYISSSAIRSIQQVCKLDCKEYL